MLLEAPDLPSSPGSTARMYAITNCVGDTVTRRWPELEKRVKSMGIKDPKRVYTAQDLAPGEQIIFAACGVTDGALLHGVRFFGDGCRTHTLAMTYTIRSVRFVDTVHLSKRPGKTGVRLY